jgi:hypothetical protein
MSSDGGDDPAAVVARYFTAIRSRDARALRELFDPGAELVTAGTTVKGTDAIAEFYETGAFGYDDLWPNPGPLEVDGRRVTVVIDLRMGGTDHTVADTFEVGAGRIKRLEIAFLPTTPV